MKKIIKNVFFVALSAFALGACKAGIETAPVGPVASGGLDFSNYVAVGNSLTAGFADNGLYLESQQNSYPQFLNDQFAKVGGNPVFNQPLFATANADGSGYLRVTGYTPANRPDIKPFGLDTLPVPLSGTFGFSGTATSLPANPYIANPAGGRSLNAGARQLRPYDGAATANQNLGIPGIAVVHVTNKTFSLQNPYFDRLLTPTQRGNGLPPNGITYLTYINSMAKKPSFFTCWLGNNDVLGYATSGGIIEDPAFAGRGAITSASLFNPSYDALVNALAPTGKEKGVLATIPDVTALPYFTTVKQSDLPSFIISNGKLEVEAPVNGVRIIVRTIPFPGLPPVGPFFPGVGSTPTAAQLAIFFNALYLANGYTDPGFIPGANGPVITVNVPNNNPRTPLNPTEVKRVNTNDGDFITLPFSTAGPALIAAGVGFINFPPAGSPPGTPPTVIPLPDGLFLDESEVRKVKTATAGYNAKIKAVALAKGLAFFDAATSFNEIIANNGVDEVVGNAAFVSGGLFSLDGVHLTPRGYGIIANQFIKAINAGYNSNIPLLDVRQRGLRGVRLP